MKIITLTLNPAFDTHCQTDTFLPFHENFAAITACHAGGKGINLSRALTVNGTDNLAVVAAGNENQDSFLNQLKENGQPVQVISVPGRIRENLTLHSDQGKETRISFGGFRATEDLLPRLEEILSREIDDDTVLTVTGSNTDGLSMARFKDLLRRLAVDGVRLVIDSRSFTPDDLRELKPWLIKPNQEEISRYLGFDVADFSQVQAAAEILHKQGISNVMISLGAQGALLVCSRGAFVATPPRTEVLSTIGAGDSSIAGFLAAAARGAGPADCLRTAVAYGTAACMTEGSLPPLPNAVADIMPQITVTEQ